MRKQEIYGADLAHAPLPTTALPLVIGVDPPIVVGERLVGFGTFFLLFFVLLFVDRDCIFRVLHHSRGLQKAITGYLLLEAWERTLDPTRG